MYNFRFAPFVFSTEQGEEKNSIFRENANLMHHYKFKSLI